MKKFQAVIFAVLSECFLNKIASPSHEKGDHPSSMVNPSAPAQEY